MSLPREPSIPTLCLCIPRVKPAPPTMPRQARDLLDNRRASLRPTRTGAAAVVGMDQSLASISPSTRTVARRASSSRLSRSRRSARAPAPGSPRRSSCSDAAFRRSRSPSRSHRSSSRAPAVRAARRSRISASSMNCPSRSSCLIPVAPPGSHPSDQVCQSVGRSVELTPRDPIPTWEEIPNPGSGIRRDTTGLIDQLDRRLIHAVGRATEGDAAQLLEGVAVIVFNPMPGQSIRRSLLRVPAFAGTSSSI